MFQRRQRRFRRRSNGRNHSIHHGNGHSQARLRTNSFSGSQNRNNFRSSMSAEKMLEKYNVLAKEAMSSGDKTLYENYLQHIDHFTRIIEDKNKNKAAHENNTSEKTTLDEKKVSNNIETQKIKT